MGEVKDHPEQQLVENQRGQQRYQEDPTGNGRVKPWGIFQSDKRQVEVYGRALLRSAAKIDRFEQGVGCPRNLTSIISSGA